MKKPILLIALAVSTMTTGCMTYRDKNEILNEASLRTLAQKASEPYRIVEFRFRTNLATSPAPGEEQVVDGKVYMDWLSREYPKVFSSSSNAIPVVVRQSMILLGDAKQQFQPGVFDTIFTGITLGIWPATISSEYKFETEIQLSNETYAEPFVWKTRYVDHVANSIVARLYYPSSRGYKSGQRYDPLPQLRTFNQLQRTSISRKSTEAERQAAKTELLWLRGFQNSPEIMKRGAALGIVGALHQLTPEQRTAVKENPIARYLAEKADEKTMP